MSVISLDLVVAMIREQGVDAYVEYTGGGCATIFAGSQVLDGDGDKRYAAAAGPGWWEPPMGTPGGSKAWADTDEFYIGVDGSEDSTHTAQPTDHEATLADQIVALVRNPPCTDHSAARPRPEETT